MKKKLKSIYLPNIIPDRRTHSNFFSVCINAIKENKDGVLDKKECIKNIMKLKEQHTTRERKKILGKTVSTKFRIPKTPLKFGFRTNKIIYKRKTLSQILLETERKNENESLKNKTTLDFKNKEEKNVVSDGHTDINLNTNLPSTNDDIKNLKINLMKKKDKPKKKINKFYSTFKKINEYLESNNIPLFELIKHNPFQTKPYQIPKGYEFLQAVKFKNYKFVKEALQASNDYLFVFDYYGQTCYHWAAKLGNIKMLLILLDYGKHHNQKDFKGRTPLYLAAVNNNREVCDLLLKYKANIHLKDKFGKSASDVAGSRELQYYLGDIMTQPFSNPIFKKKVLDFLKVRENEIEKKKIVKKLKENEEEHKNENDEEKD